MAKFIEGNGNWTQYRELQPLLKIDFHQESKRAVSYNEAMEEVAEKALKALKVAQDKGISYVLFTHGHSTSRNGNTTARSQIRGLMRGSLATPFVIRTECIQHDSVFVARIKKAKSS